ncbi:MAG: hypothetical protein WDN30_02285 [Pararobbsia sp.]
MAVHLYTGKRVTGDIDAEFAGRVILPQDLAVVVTLEDGIEQVVYLDTNYNPTFALMHDDYQDDAHALHLGLGQIRVSVAFTGGSSCQQDRPAGRQRPRGYPGSWFDWGLTNADAIEAPSK